MPRQTYTATVLTRETKPTTLYTYFVTGRGRFPLDMLRYDRAHPKGSDDAAKMSGDYDRELRSISLRSYQRPTDGRWASFGWQVGVDDLAKVMGR